jgi:hypothetical protein
VPQLKQLISDDEMKHLIREICSLDAPPSTHAARLGDEGTFPKLLALDMNAWIYLSKAHYGRAEHPSHVVGKRCAGASSACRFGGRRRCLGATSPISTRRRRSWWSRLMVEVIAGARGRMRGGTACWGERPG